MNTSGIRQQHLEYNRFFTKYIFVKKAVLLRIYISVKKQLDAQKLDLYSIFKNGK